MLNFGDRWASTKAWGNWVWAYIHVWPGQLSSCPNHTKLPAVELLENMLKIRYLPTAFHTITTKDDDGWCHKWLVWAGPWHRPLSSKLQSLLISIITWAAGLWMVEWWPLVADEPLGCDGEAVAVQKLPRISQTVFRGIHRTCLNPKDHNM